MALNWAWRVRGTTTQLSRELGATDVRTVVNAKVTTRGVYRGAKVISTQIIEEYEETTQKERESRRPTANLQRCDTAGRYECRMKEDASALDAIRRDGVSCRIDSQAHMQ